MYLADSYKQQCMPLLRLINNYLNSQQFITYPTGSWMSKVYITSFIYHYIVTILEILVLLKMTINIHTIIIIMI